MRRLKLSPLLLAALLIAVVNAAVLSFVALNRSGSPSAQLTLDQRAFPPWGYVRWDSARQRPSGVARLELDVVAAHEAYIPPGRQSPWLSREGLTAIGAPPPATQARRAGQRFVLDQTRPVFVALQWDGPAYADALERCLQHIDPTAPAAAQKNSQLICEAKRQGSRLMMMDVDTDARRLRAHYPATDTAILAARLAFTQQADGTWTASVEPPPLELSPPESLRARLPALLAGKMPLSIVVAFGQRNEPWLVDVRAQNPPQR